MSDNPYRRLPAVNEVLDAAPLRTAARSEAVVGAVRSELADLRRRLAQGEAVDGELEAESVARRVAAALQHMTAPHLRGVINATGIVLHTNLGRAPLAEEAARAAYEAARGYLNLELDLATGVRSSRQDAVRGLLCQLTGAEAATAVNNNAAATVLALRALCQGREVVVSRGQLIEIGGSFRIPEIMAASGAVLREVGTTNITRLTDFEAAVGSSTAALLQVHPSNYRVVGFTASVPLPELVALGRQHNLIVIDDVGSGALVDLAPLGLAGEPSPRASIAAGADLVLFSGDKLLGGPQAGVLVGRKDLIARMEKDPLMRAFRLDKMTLAALEATLRLYVLEATDRIPVLHLLWTPVGDLRQRAETLAERLRSLSGVSRAAAVEDQSYAGGGSLPDQALPSWAVEVQAESLGEDELARRLRLGTPAVLGRVRDGVLVLDMRTVFPEQLEALAKRVEAALTATA